MRRGGKPVADDGSKVPSPFDLQTVKNLVRLMSQHDLSEIDLRDGDLRIRLRRGAREVAVAPAAVPPAVAAPALQPPATPPPSPEAGPPAQAIHLIKSPTPGTFYSASSPDAEPFVRIGSPVTPATVVCVIEAMKIFNEITAGVSGVIAEVCVKNGEPVEYNKVLFRVDPSA